MNITSDKDALNFLILKVCQLEDKLDTLLTEHDKNEINEAYKQYFAKFEDAKVEEPSRIIQPNRF